MLVLSPYAKHRQLLPPALQGEEGGGRRARGRGEWRGRTRVTERDKKSTRSFQNCHSDARNSFYGMSAYQYIIPNTILILKGSEYVPLPARRSRFTVFQRRSERQHLQLAITSRAGALPSLYNPRRGPPPASNGPRASRPSRARRPAGRPFLTRARLSLYQVHM